MASTSVVIADFQCFVDNLGGFIIKEFSLFDQAFKSSRHWIFRPPKQCKQTDKGKRTNYWLENYYHKIKWEYGEVEYEIIQDIFKFIDCKYKFVFVKGLEKKRFLLQHLYRCSVLNMEDFGCPKIDSLIINEKGSHCIVHNNCKEKCTLYRTETLSTWLKLNCIDFGN